MYLVAWDGSMAGLVGYCFTFCVETSFFFLSQISNKNANRFVWYYSDVNVGSA